MGLWITAFFVNMGCVIIGYAMGIARRNSEKD